MARKATGKIRSMTGFGRAEAAKSGVRAAVEIRSVNQRHLRVSVHLPPWLAALEPQVRELVRQGARRGQIDVSLNVTDGGRGAAPLPDPELVKAYVQAWRKLGKALKLPGEVDLGTLAGMPGVFAGDAENAAAKRSWAAVREATKKALAAFDGMRRAEGAVLARDIAKRIDWIEASTERLAAGAETGKTRLAERIRERVETLLGELGAGERVSGPSLEQEIAVAADRADVSEEVERIRSHTAQFRATLRGGSPAGRKLEFIAQELQREISTLGAKVADAEAGCGVVEFKTELEKIREQIQNAE